MSSNYIPRIYLAGKAAEPVPALQQPTMSAAERAWAEIKDLKDIAVFEAFRKQFGPSSAVYDRLAAQKIAALKAVPPPKPPRTTGMLYIKVSGKTDVAPLMERVLKNELSVGYSISTKEDEADFSLLVSVANEPPLSYLSSDYTGRLVWEAQSPIRLVLRANTANRIVGSRDIVGKATSNDAEDVHLRENARLDSKRQIVNFVRSSVLK